MSTVKSGNPVRVGDVFTWKPSGWGDGKDYPGVRVPSKVTGVVTYVSDKLFVAEAEVAGHKISESFLLVKGVKP